MQIDPDREYSPREIEQAGWITNTRGKSDYGFILKLIGRGLLQAKNINPSGEMPYFRVRGKWILEYLTK